jgi:hypothetical protein
MQVKCKPNKSFRGDRSRRIEIHDAGRSWVFMLIYPRSDRLGRYWESDCYSNRFKTITDAKAFARARVGGREA